MNCREKRSVCKCSCVVRCSVWSSTSTAGMPAESKFNLEIVRNHAMSFSFFHISLVLVYFVLCSTNLMFALNHFTASTLFLSNCPSLDKTESLLFHTPKFGWSAVSFPPFESTGTCPLLILWYRLQQALLLSELEQTRNVPELSLSAEL